MLIGGSVVFGLATAGQDAWAQAAAVPVPPAVAPGAIERQLQPQPPELKSGGIVVPPPRDAAAPENAAALRFELKAVTIDGATALPPADLARTYAPLVGRSISLADLYDVANAITALYVQAGYALSFAVVPAQTIGGDGRAVISVVEGYVADIRINGAPARTERVVRGYAARIGQSRPLKMADLERALLLANDLPGTTVRSVVNRLDGGERGAVRLDLNVTYRPVQASALVDNRGSKALGPWRGVAGVTLASPLGLGDGLTLRALSTLGNDSLRYGAANWTAPIDRNGTSVALSASYSVSAPGTPRLAAAGFAGTGWIGAAGVEHVLVRNRRDRLTLSAALTGKQLDTRIADRINSRDRIAALDAAVNWSRRDGAGLSSAMVRAAQGLDAFGATTGASRLRSRASGSGRYTVLQVSVGRLQDLGGPFQLNLTAYGQAASRGLLASEQCGYGGAQFGRGFDDFEIAGDHCLMGSAEFRYSPSWGRRNGMAAQLFASADAGRVWLSGAALPGEDRTAAAAAVGLGLRLALPQGVNGSLELDQALGRVVGQQGNRDSRVFVSLSKAF